MSVRESGFYWVMSEGEWEVAYWWGDRWSSVFDSADGWDVMTAPENIDERRLVPPQFK